MLTPEIFADDTGFIEGPVWTGSTLHFVSISRSLVYELDGKTGDVVGEVRVGGGPNGLTLGEDGLYVAQNGGIFGAPENARPGVQRIDEQGVSYVGDAAFVAPNDLCFGPDGRLYVSDPIAERGLHELLPGNVYSVDPKTGHTAVALADLPFPNGLAVDATGQYLYLALSFAQTIERYRFTESGLAHDGTACTLSAGRPDGFALDTDGNLWICVPGSGGVEVYSPDGERLDRIDCGDGALTTNCCFGGADMSTLFITAAGRGAVLAVDTGATGLPLLPFRG
ncbi:SMP-30/gluconolactonase/LRE family protein [Rhodococcus sp. WS4]|nr:SMP-30/gluconolactonase/LRE family protein [Rhodococcus sp. WS4]